MQFLKCGAAVDPAVAAIVVDMAEELVQAVMVLKVVTLLQDNR
jgi:hypothetical protein